MDSHRDAVLSALDVYASNNTGALFAKAMRLLGIPGPAADQTNIDLIVDSAEIVNVDMKYIPSIAFEEMSASAYRCVCQEFALVLPQSWLRLST